jgi:hypothetical protein
MRPIGYVDACTRFHVAGWAADQDDWGGALRVVILVNGREVKTVTADQHRENLDQIGDGATGKYAFRYYFEAPLSPYRRHEIVAKVRPGDHVLPSASATVLEPIEGYDSGEQFRPHAPILLSTMGRSGSTVLMAILARHPKVIVAGRRPFEVELGCYYAYALRTLTAAGDQIKSLRSDRITAKDYWFHLGFNPYFEPSFATYFREPGTLSAFINRRAAPRLVTAFRGIMLDYYEEVARDQNKPYPLYFAEKSLPEADARLGVRSMFRNCREIVLVRDLRDALCSFMSYGKLSLEDSLQALKSSAIRFVEIEAERDESFHFVKYEDLIQRRRETLVELARFLGISEFPEDGDSMTGLFGEHATTRSPAESIGRWRRDLTPEQLAHCAFLNPLLERLGYDV